MPESAARKQGFTLIELSIVLVIIGLIVGGVLVGRELISAAQMRATVTQIERYNTAVNTFKGKYGQLPGNIQPILVTTFGFQTVPIRAGTAGRGSGNGVIEGFDYTNLVPGTTQTGEPVFFWEDLSANSGLIEGTFNTAGEFAPATTITPSSTPNLDAYLPEAKLGGGNYVLVYGLGGVNYFEITSAASGGVTIHGNFEYPQHTVTVKQAYLIDQKMDDGLPQSGNVQASVMDDTDSPPLYWASVAGFGPLDTGPYTTPTPGSSTTCYDNGGVNGAIQQYSMKQSDGSGMNCALMFRFQ